MTRNAQRPLLCRIGLLVGKDGGVGDGLNEACSKSRRGYSKNNVAISALASERISRGRKIKLRDVATGSVAPSSDHEKGVDVAVGDAIAFFEARLADGSIRCNEDRKSTRLNSSHRCISYAVFCLKKKKQE